MATPCSRSLWSAKPGADYDRCYEHSIARKEKRRTRPWDSDIDGICGMRLFYPTQGTSKPTAVERRMSWKLTARIRLTEKEKLGLWKKPPAAFHPVFGELLVRHVNHGDSGLAKDSQGPRRSNRQAHRCDQIVVIRQSHVPTKSCWDRTFSGKECICFGKICVSLAYPVELIGDPPRAGSPRPSMLRTASAD